MIAFKDGLPLLERPEGTVTVFNGGWLRQALRRAARKAGYTEFWLAEDLTRSVVFYLKFHYSDNTIPVPQLQGAVRSALRQIGYEEIAQHFGGRAVLRKILLPQFTSPEDATDGAGFFRKLASRIRLLRPASTGVVHFCGLEECATALSPMSAGGNLCGEELTARKHEIVGFVQSQLLASGWDEVRVCIS